MGFSHVALYINGCRGKSISSLSDVIMSYLEWGKTNNVIEPVFFYNGESTAGEAVSVVQSQKAVTAYFSSKQLLPFSFAGQSIWIQPSEQCFLPLVSLVICFEFQNGTL